MQALEHRAVFLSSGNDVERLRIGVDDRSARDPDVRRDHAADVGGSARLGHDGGRIEEADLPRRCCGETIGVEGIDAVILGRDVDDVVQALTGDGYVGDVERLRKDVSVDRIRTGPSRTMSR